MGSSEAGGLKQKMRRRHLKQGRGGAEPRCKKPWLSPPLPTPGHTPRPQATPPGRRPHSRRALASVKVAFILLWKRTLRFSGQNREWNSEAATEAKATGVGGTPLLEL